MKKGYYWFYIYTALIPISICLETIFVVIRLCGIYTSLEFEIDEIAMLLLYTIIICIPYIIYLFFKIKIWRDIINKKVNSIKNLCILLLFSWIINFILFIFNFSQDKIIPFIAMSIFYTCNITYFENRKDLFANYKEDDLIIESEDETDDFIKKLKEKNGEDYIIECKVCGQKISYNKNGTCEECHQKILKRLEEKNNTVTTSSEPVKENLKTVECKVCGKEIPSNGKNICNECEAKLAEKLKEKEKRFCTKCGKEINQEWQFCNYCGNKLK